MNATEPIPKTGADETVAAAATAWEQPALLHQSLDEFCRHGVLVTDTQLIVRHWNRWLAERSSLAAKEMGGSLSVHSGGPGRGAAFTLELPLKANGDSSVPPVERDEKPTPDRERTAAQR